VRIVNLKKNFSEAFQGIRPLCDPSCSHPYDWVFVSRAPVPSCASLGRQAITPSLPLQPSFQQLSRGLYSKSWEALPALPAIIDGELGEAEILQGELMVTRGAIDVEAFLANGFIAIEGAFDGGL
jgi:hypothetical protein